MIGWLMIMDGALAVQEIGRQMAEAKQKLAVDELCRQNEVAMIDADKAFAKKVGDSTRVIEARIAALEAENADLRKRIGLPAKGAE